MKLRSSVLGFVLALALALGVIAPSAMASDICVGVSPPRCPVQEQPFTENGFTTAVANANFHAGPDTVVLASGTISVSNPTNVTPNGDTSIVGAGAHQTVFSAEDATPSVLQIWFLGTGGTVSGISVDVTSENSNGNALSIRNGTLTDFSIAKSDDVGSAGFVGLDLGDGATARRGEIAIDSNAGVGLKAGFKSATASDITITGGLGSSAGLVADAPDSGTVFDFRRLSISGVATGVVVTDHDFTLADSLIDMGTSVFRAGLVASTATASSHIVLHLDRDTIVGNSNSFMGQSQTGISLNASDPASSLAANIRDVVSYSPNEDYNPLRCQGSSTEFNASLEAHGWAYGHFYADLHDHCTSGFVEAETLSLVLHDPKFRDFAGGDYRLRWDSPLVDFGVTGDITGPGAIPSDAKDVNFGKRVVDGDGDGTAETDIGALEYQRSPPTIELIANKSQIQPGDAVSFAADISDAESEAYTIAWDFGDGATAGDVASVQHTYTAFGTYNAVITVVDESGASSTRVKTISVPDPNAIPPRQSPPSTIIIATRVTAKPKKSFPAGKKSFSIAKRGQPSFTLTFENAAKAKFTVQSIGKKKKLKSTKVSATLAVKDGATKFFFGGGKLKVGKYRVTITPLSATGKSGQPVTVDIKLK
jgi:PKD repeat protein